MDEVNTLTRIYLNDHRAGAAGGVSLAQRIARNNHGTPLGAEMQHIVTDLRADIASLESIARNLDVTPDPIKQWAARLGELVGRVKFNGRVRGYSPLSRVLELELLLGGIDAKRSMWRALKSAAVPVPPDIDLDELEARASDQRARLVPHHGAAARLAFSDAEIESRA